MTTKQQQIGLAVVVIGIMVAVALAPMALESAIAKRVTTTTCEIGGSTRDGPCPGNSGNNDNCNQQQDSVTKAGKGKGSGEIKDESSSC